jgi:5-methylcytosine-specific restriction protein A
MQRPCLTPRCPRMAEVRGHCRPCATDSNRTRRQRRGPRLYDTKRWTLTRRRVLFDRPLCEAKGCEQIATDVHHLEKPEDRPDLAYRLSNLRALCHEHHSAITRAEQQGRRVQF